MKARITAVAIILSAAAIIMAITEQWSVPAGKMVYQTVADGAGGCAVFYVDTNNVGHLAWLDKKGQEKYRDTLVPGIASPVVACTKKMLVYTVYTTSSVIYAVAVDSKGNKTEIKKDPAIMYPPNVPGLGTGVLGTDKKGFFIQSINNSNMTATLYRYTYK
jgi:hypothetical protein